MPTTIESDRLYRVPEAVLLLGLSRSKVYELLKSRRLESVKEGGSRRIPASSIAAYVALLRSESGSTRANAA
ncbi:helix-turn-helix domain-containing protein [Rhizohabitans arisaemae]|uniref:helix-turn-helix domain-containing protein n=1 Tax=Rhizohabitans arisaemae TaxID=2720610 RepID=UPI0024B084F1|nr:helix-turn-helix domain-containing protein [Rhizohabitans arisaemae]